MLVEQSYAEAYGWTPEQVARLPVRYADLDPLIRQAKGKAAHLKAMTERKRPGR